MDQNTLDGRNLKPILSHSIYFLSSPTFFDILFSLFNCVIADLGVIDQLERNLIIPLYRND